eukprot:13871046-Heterocapsa_arctica.AAC.1
MMYMVARMGKLMNHMIGKMGKIMNHMIDNMDNMRNAQNIYIQSMEANSDHSNIPELYQHQ